MNQHKINSAELIYILNKMKLIIIKKRPLIFFAYLATIIYVIIFLKIQTMFGLSMELENLLKLTKVNSYKNNLFSRVFENEAKNLYLNDKFLKLVHLAFEGVDSKKVVDRATKMPLSAVLSALESLEENDPDKIRAFSDKYFHEPGYEIGNL